MDIYRTLFIAAWGISFFTVSLYRRKATQGRKFNAKFGEAYSEYRRRTGRFFRRASE